MKKEIIKPAMWLVAHEYGYHFYEGKDKKGKYIYNVIPENEYPNHNPPFAGYGSAAYICGIKDVPNLFGKHSN